MNPARLAYLIHRNHAKSRGIKFYFTFTEWVHWWETHLGPNWLLKRGIKTGQFVMARIGDIGAYEANNVRCITSNANHHESTGTRGSKNGAAKLTEADVRAIFKMEGNLHVIATKFGTTRSRIYRIKTGRTWKHLHLI